MCYNSQNLHQELTCCGRIVILRQQSLPCCPLPSLQCSNHTRKLTLLHFKAWPENGHPPLSSVMIMLQVMERMDKGRGASGDKQGPIVVMCKWARTLAPSRSWLCVCLHAHPANLWQCNLYIICCMCSFPAHSFKVYLLLCHYLLLLTLSDGMSRSGVFITCMTEIERIKVEGGVDVFQTVKAARAQRPHMVNTSVSEWTCPFL